MHTVSKLNRYCHTGHQQRFRNSREYEVGNFQNRSQGQNRTEHKTRCCPLCPLSHSEMMETRDNDDSTDAENSECEKEFIAHPISALALKLHGSENPILDAVAQKFSISNTIARNKGDEAQTTVQLIMWVMVWLAKVDPSVQEVGGALRGLGKNELTYHRKFLHSKGH